jgi:hypothetical protein
VLAACIGGSIDVIGFAPCDATLIGDHSDRDFAAFGEFGTFVRALGERRENRCIVGALGGAAFLLSLRLIGLLTNAPPR